MRIETWIRMAAGLGVLAVVAALASHLALTDIYHAEGDVSLEWNVLRVCFGIIILSQAISLVTLVKVSRNKPHGQVP